jgi:hypothetical protein
MARGSFFFAAFVALGCANPMPTTVQPHLDFGLPSDDLAAGDAGVDLAVGDLAVGDLADLAVADQAAGDLAVENAIDLGGPDLALAVDQALAPDLTPACDLAGALPSRLWVAAVAAGNTLYTARFDTTDGWHELGTTAAVNQVSLALVGGVPTVADRKTDDSVEVTRYDACLDQYPSPAQIASLAITLNRPALVGGSAADLVFRGSFMSDQRLYHSSSTDATRWSQPTTQGNFLSTLHPAAARWRGAVHAIFTGTDGHIYDGTVDDGGGGGSAVRIDDGTHTSTQPPAVIVDGTGRLVVVWAQAKVNSGDPDPLVWFVRSADGTTSTGPSAVSSFTSPLGPALALDKSGNVVLAFSGDDKHIYVSTLSDTTWGAAEAASGSCSGGEVRDCETTLPPAIATGLGSDDLELVYVRDSDGKLAHVRKQSTGWGSETPFTTTNFLTQPALVTSP